jgi:2Fe-2S ferredoxin
MRNPALVQVTYRTHDGRSGVFEAKAGQSLMAAAKAACVPGILAECGGSMVCGTCQVFIDEQWFPRLTRPTEMEADLISFGLNPAANARLSCQITVTEAMDGLALEIPTSQR